MPSESPAVSERWTSTLKQSLNVFARLVREPQVRHAWTNSSTLPGYTVGGIAGHVLSLMLGLQQRLDSRPADVEVVPYDQWYGPALATKAQYDDLIEVGERLAARGPDRIANDLEVVGDQLAQTLKHTTSQVTIPLNSLPGKGVNLTDFLRTRFVEITVHGDDIAVSVDLDTPDFPATAWTIAASVISEQPPTNADDAAVVLAATRPGRR